VGADLIDREEMILEAVVDSKIPIRVTPDRKNAAGTNIEIVPAWA
jgi:hypothetical protein